MITPITLAAGDGGGIFFFIMIAVIGFINWLAEQKKKNAASQNTSQKTPRAPAKPIPTGESEQERLRRFLEALGLPVGQAAPPQPPRPQAPPPQPQPTVRSVPTLVQRPTPPPRSAPPRPLPVPKPMARATPAPELPDEGPTDPNWLRHFSEPTVDPDYNQHPSMDAHPGGHAAREARLAPDQTEFVHGKRSARRGAKQSTGVAAMLKSRASLRKAFVIREVLGPPPGLQS